MVAKPGKLPWYPFEIYPRHPLPGDWWVRYTFDMLPFLLLAKPGWSVLAGSICNKQYPDLPKEILW